MEAEYAYLRGSPENLKKPLLRFEEKTYTGQSFLLLIEEFSRFFSSLGVQPGERAVLLLENSPELLLSMLAIQKLGGIVVPLNPRSAESEWRYVVDDTRPALVLSETVLDLAPDVMRVTRADLNSAIRLDSQAEKVTPGVDGLRFEPEKPAFICYTSGTASRPKGVVLSHGNVLGCLRSLKTAWRWTQQDRLLLALPLFHVHGLIVAALGSLWNGSEIVLHRRFDAERVLQDLSERGCTVFMGVPAMYLQLLAAAQQRLSRNEELHPHLRKMRLFISGSAPLPAVSHQEFERIFQQKILERYGMTEALMILSNPYDGERKPGSVGLPLPEVEVRLVDEDGNPTSPSELGEIWVRGPAVFREYWNGSAAAEEAFSHGWFKTGDVAFRDEAGYFFIAGRKSLDIIKTSGFKISAREIEEKLLEIASVREAAVVGVPDARCGEQVTAFIRCQQTPLEGRLASTAEASRVLQTDLDEFLKPRLARYKHPVRYIFVESLPRNAMGKVSKRELKQLAQSLF